MGIWGDTAVQSIAIGDCRMSMMKKDGTLLVMVPNQGFEIDGICKIQLATHASNSVILILFPVGHGVYEMIKKHVGGANRKK